MQKIVVKKIMGKNCDKITLQIREILTGGLFTHGLYGLYPY